MTDQEKIAVLLKRFDYQHEHVVYWRNRFFKGETPSEISRAQLRKMGLYDVEAHNAELVIRAELG